MSEIYEMVAKTFQGLEGVLADELKALGAENVEIGRRMVSFKGDKEMMYKANFCCHTALRILKPLYKFHASDADELYEKVKTYQWDDVLKIDQTFSIDSTVNSEDFRHSKFVTYRVKDAIADFFNEKYQKRPSIRITTPDILFNVHISGNDVILSLDSSGDPLFKRGWRVDQVEAPINEVLAAGLIKLSGWNGESNFVDPMCGSGTILIEAAMIAANINPGVYRSGYAFQRWTDYDEELFNKIYNDDSGEREFKYKIYGSDVLPKAIGVSARNIKSAGVSKYIELELKDIADITEAPQPAGVMLTNPPYGERLEVEDIADLYHTIGERLKKAFLGYNAWVISMPNEAFDKIGLKPSLKYPILNGELECELREYVIFSGKYDDFRAEGKSVKNEDFHSEAKPAYRKPRFESDDEKDGKPFRRRESGDDRRGGGFHRDGDRRDDSRGGGFHRDGDRDDRRGGGFHRDGDRDDRRGGGFHRDGDRDDRRSGGFHRDGDRDDRRGGGFHRDGDRDDRRGGGFHRDVVTRDDRRGGFRHDDDRRGGGFHRDGDFGGRRRDDRDGEEKHEFLHGEDVTRQFVRFRKPRLSSEAEKPIIRGRRNGWRRRDLKDDGEQGGQQENGNKPTEEHSED
jgi:putative N6-adenine-specific DNA methylase